MLMVVVIAALSSPAIAVAQTGVADVPRFKYVLPEGFRGWACVDFGVEGAATRHFPSELIQIVNGNPRRVESNETQHRGEYDSNNPIARYCVFFGSAAAAAAFQRPPTLTESRLGTDPVLRHF